MNKKMVIGAATIGALVGAAAIAGKMREDNRNQFEKIVDQVEEWLK